MISSYLGRLPESLWGHQTHRLVKKVDAEVSQTSHEWPAMRRQFLFSQIMRVARAIITISPGIAAAGLYTLYKVRVMKAQDCLGIAFLVGFLFAPFASIPYILSIEACNTKIHQTTQKLYSYLFMQAMESPQNFSSLIWKQWKRCGNNISDLNTNGLKNRVLTDEGLTTLAETCPNLESLSINARYFTEKGLKTLALRCPKLKEIRLSNFNKSVDCKVFEEFKKLQVLDLHAPQLTHKQFTRLPYSQTLSSLTITAPLSRKSLEHLAHQPNQLRTVRIYSDHLLPEDFKLLGNRNFSNLQRVNFNNQSPIYPTSQNGQISSAVKFFNQWERGNGTWHVSKTSNQKCTLYFVRNRDDD